MSGSEMTFERALAELEEIADSLERDDLDLDQALALFERGVERLRVAGGLLDAAHGRVEELVEDADGALVVRSLDVGQEGAGGSGG